MCTKFDVKLEFSTHSACATCGAEKEVANVSLISETIALITGSHMGCR